jgi:hypothetical protein
MASHGRNKSKREKEKSKLGLSLPFYTFLLHRYSGQSRLLSLSFRSRLITPQGGAISRLSIVHRADLVLERFLFRIFANPAAVTRSDSSKIHLQQSSKVTPITRVSQAFRCSSAFFTRINLCFEGRVQIHAICKDRKGCPMLSPLYTSPTTRLRDRPLHHK